MTPVQRAAWFDRGVLATVLVAGVVLYWVFYALGGAPLVLGVGAVGFCIACSVGWWLHTWSERQGPK